MALITSGTAYVDTVAGTNDASHGGTSGSGACATLAYLIANRIGTLTGPLIIDCHGSTADTTQPDIGDTAIGTSATNTLTIRANTSDRASLGWDTGKYRLSVTGANIIRFREDYVILDGLQLELTPSGHGGFFTDTATSATDVRIIKNCVLKGDGAGTYRCELSGGDVIYYFINCLFYNWGGNSTSYASCGYNARYFYNCTAIMSDSADFAIRNDGATSVVCKNTYAAGGTSGAFFGTITGDYNASDDTTAGGKFTHYVNSVAADTDTFVDVTIDGGENFHLAADGLSPLQGAGAAPGGSAPLNYTTDIDGETVTTWCIGADGIAATSSFARPSSDVAGGTFRSIVTTAPFGPRVIA